MLAMALKSIFEASVPASSMFIRALGTWFTWFASLVGFFFPQTDIKGATFSQTQA